MLQFSNLAEFHAKNHLRAPMASRSPHVIWLGARRICDNASKYNPAIWLDNRGVSFGRQRFTILRFGKHCWPRAGRSSHFKYIWFTEGTFLSMKIQQSYFFCQAMLLCNGVGRYILAIPQTLLRAWGQVEKPRVELRQYFPETWLFQLSEAGPAGQLDRLDLFPQTRLITKRKRQH